MAKLTAKQRLDNLKNTALEAVSYVGMANYDERERAAKRAIEKSFRTGQYVNVDDE